MSTKAEALQRAVERRAPLRRAVEIVGGQTELARRIGAPLSSVSHWLLYSMRGVPAEYAGKIEDATRGAVSRFELRPDVFGAHAPRDAQIRKQTVHDVAKRRPVLSHRRSSQTHE